MYFSYFIMWICEWCLMEVHGLFMVCGLPVKIMTKKIKDIIGKFIGEYVELIQKTKKTISRGCS